MKDFLINPSDNLKLESIINNIPHALILDAPTNFGANQSAKFLADKIGGRVDIIMPVARDEVDLINGHISVEQIRSLRQIASNKTSTLHIIVIYNSHSMTKTAQNAFLKLLEEPNAKTMFILASENINNFLPTITSRTQIVKLHPISQEDSLKYIKKLGVNDSKMQNQLIYLASGLPLELNRLATDSNYFEFRSETIREARQLLSSNLYQKILAVNQLKDNKAKVLETLDDLTLIIKNTIKDKPDGELLVRLDKILQARSNILSGGNLRLNLLSAVI